MLTASSSTAFCQTHRLFPAPWARVHSRSHNPPKCLLRATRMPRFAKWSISCPLPPYVWSREVGSIGLWPSGPGLHCAVMPNGFSFAPSAWACSRAPPMVNSRRNQACTTDMSRGNASLAKSLSRITAATSERLTQVPNVSGRSPAVICSAWPPAPFVSAPALTMT